MPRYTYDHIHLRAPDAEAAAQWFAAKLGAEITARTSAGKPRVDVRLGGTPIFITEADATDLEGPAALNKGMDHFAFEVDDLDEAVADLKGKGVEFTMEPTSPRPGIRICFIRGPENISIELLERRAA
jgi:catechol 2,3-dioxygenase-like lactoylglutathione lyase family enzyme